MDSWETSVFYALMLYLQLTNLTSVAGAGKSVLSYVHLSRFLSVN